MNESELERLIAAARARTMTPAEREEQRRSFVHGNINIENGRVTREVVDQAAEQMGPVELRS